MITEMYPSKVNLNQIVGGTIGIYFDLKVESYSFYRNGDCG